MKNARARLALLGVLAFCACGAASAAPASAFTSYYNCVLKPTYTWCDGQANGSYDGQATYDYNEAWYPGTWDGTVTACQVLVHTPTNNTLVGASCAGNWTATDYGANYTMVEADVLQISGGNHSINGMAIAD